MKEVDSFVSVDKARYNHPAFAEKRSTCERFSQVLFYCVTKAFTCNYVST